MVKMPIKVTQIYRMWCWVRRVSEEQCVDKCNDHVLDAMSWQGVVLGCVGVNESVHSVSDSGLHAQVI